MKSLSAVSPVLLARPVGGDSAVRLACGEHSAHVILCRRCAQSAPPPTGMPLGSLSLAQSGHLDRRRRRPFLPLCWQRSPPPQSGHADLRRPHLHHRRLHRWSLQLDFAILCLHILTLTFSCDTVPGGARDPSWTKASLAILQSLHASLKPDVRIESITIEADVPALEVFAVPFR